MLASISPVGETSRGQRWPITATAYTVASTAGGALVGWLLAGVGAIAVRAGMPHPSTPLVLAIIGTVLLLGAAVDSGRLPVRLRGWERQVDERWLTRYRGWVYGAGFGFQLGTGLMTIVSTTATYAVWLSALLLAEPTAGALLGASFGLVRALPLVAIWRVRTPDQLRRLHRNLDVATGAVARTTTVVMVVLGLTALGGAGVLLAGGATT